MSTTWVMVANASRARLFSQVKKFGELHLVKEFSHPESRQKEAAFTTDRPGRYQASGNTQSPHGTYQAPSTPKENEHDRFARELAETLENGRLNSSYGTLIVVAAPHFHGLINKHLGTQVRGLVQMDIEKDYTTLTTSELAERLRDYRP